MTLQYLIGTPSDKYNPTRDITKLVRAANIMPTISKHSEIRLLVNNPKGVFTDSSLDDYIDNDEDYVVLIKYDSRNRFIGIIVDRSNDDTPGSTDQVWTIRTNDELLKRCMFTRRYTPEDYVYVEDAIDDMFKVAAPRPGPYFNVFYQVQDGIEQDFDDMTVGALPTGWVENDSDGTLLVVENQYVGTDPAYSTFPNSVEHKADAGTVHTVDYDNLYLEGDKVIVSVRAYIEVLPDRDLYVEVRSADDAQMALCRFDTDNGGNVRMYIYHNGVATLVWGPAVPSDGFFTFRFVLDLTNDEYAFYWGNTADPIRWGHDGAGTGGTWAAARNNNWGFTNDSKDAVGTVRLYQANTSGAARYVYLDDFYALEGDKPLRTPLTSEHRFSAANIFDAITELCAYYGIEWRSFPDPLDATRYYVQTFKRDTGAASVLTLDNTEVTHANVKQTAIEFKNFFIVRGKDDIIGLAADVDSINDRGFFPMEKQDTKLETVKDCEEYAEYLRNQYGREPLKAILDADGEKVGYEVLMSLEPGQNVTVTSTRVGLGTSQVYVIARVKMVLEGDMKAQIQLGDIWKSAAVLQHEVMSRKKKADEETPKDLVHMRFVAARVALSGDWDWAGSTNPPGVVSESGITEFGRRAIREMQVTNAQEDVYISPYVERPEYFKVIDDQGAVYENGGGLIAIDTKSIGVIAVDGSGDKYCEIEFSGGDTLAAFFTWKRTEVVSRRIYTLTSELGTGDNRLELDSTQGLRVHDKLTITNSVGNSVVVYVADVIGNTVYIYGAHANYMDIGAPAVAYTNVLFGTDHDVTDVDAAEDIDVAMTVRFTNEETPTSQGQVTEDGLLRLCQRLRDPAGREEDITAVDVGLKRFSVADTSDFNVGDYISVLDVSEATGEVFTIDAITVNTFIFVEEAILGAYGGADNIQLVCYPWAQVVVGNDDTARASNYYNSRSTLLGELTRVDGHRHAASTADNIKLMVLARGGAFPPAMANTILDGNHAAVTALKVKSTKGMNTGQTIYVGDALPLDVRTIVSVDSPTQLTVSANVTANDEDPVCTGLRRSVDDIETLFEVGIADLPVEVGEGATQYYLGAFLADESEVETGFGAYQYDEYLNRDSENNEYDLKDAGTAAVPDAFYSDEETTAEYMTDVTGTGMQLKPIRRIWSVHVRDNPLNDVGPFLEGGGGAQPLQRYPSLDELLGDTDTDEWPTNLVDKIDMQAEVGGSSQRAVKKLPLEHDKGFLEKNFAVIDWMVPDPPKYTEINIGHAGVLLQFDVSWMVNNENRHASKLAFQFYGHGRSFDHGAKEWKNGVYAFLWVDGTYEHEGNIPLRWMNISVQPHWELMPLVDSSGADINGTDIESIFQIGYMDGGDTHPKQGNLIDRATFDGKIYLLLIPRYPIKANRPAYVAVDYAGLSLDTGFTPDASKIKSFRKGVDYLWSKDWQWIIWPESTPTRQVSLAPDVTYKGSVDIVMSEPTRFTPGDVIYVGTDVHTVRRVYGEHWVEVSPPLKKDHAVNTIIKKTGLDYGAGVIIDGKYHHQSHPVKSTFNYPMTSVGVRTKVKSQVGVALTVVDSSGFAAGDSVITSGQDLAQEWNTVASVADEVTINLGGVPSFTPKFVGRCAVAFMVGDDVWADSQQVIKDSRSVYVTVGRLHSHEPLRGEDINPSYVFAGIPGACVDYIDHTNRLLYYSALKSTTIQRHIDSGTAVTLPGGPYFNYILRDNGKAWTPTRWKRGMVRITAGTGVGQERTINWNNATDLYTDSPWDINPDATSDYIVFEENITRLHDGSEKLLSDADDDWIAYYDARFMIESAAGMIIRDHLETQSFTGTSDVFKAVRNGRVFMEAKGGGDDYIFKAGVVLGEVKNAIDNTRLCSQEQKVVVGEQHSFILNATYGPGLMTHVANGRIRVVIDVVNADVAIGQYDLDAKAYIGDTQITIDNTAWANPGDLILLHPAAAALMEIGQVKTVDDATHITLESPLLKAHPTGVNIVWDAHQEKIYITLFNPYHPPDSEETVQIVVPFKQGAIYKTQYAKAVGKILARARFTENDLAPPVILKASETLKAGIELNFTYD